MAQIKYNHKCIIEYREYDFIEPSLIFSLVAQRVGTIFLDSNFEHKHYGCYSFIVINPLKIYQNNTLSDAQIKAWQELFASNRQDQTKLPPFCGGLMGYISYEYAYCMGLYTQIFAFDHLKKICYLIVCQINGFDIDYSSQLDELISLYNLAKNKNITITNKILPKIKFEANFNQQSYCQIVKEAQKYIREGDIFEVNLAQCFTAKLPDKYPIIDLYQKLAKINSAPFAAYLKFAEIEILSASVERFIAIRQNKIEARPIKGTIKRSFNIDEDKTLIKKLESNAKERAENIMIVDLMRHDLSKICTASSVVVSELCVAESFTNLHHLVSVIEGELEGDKTIFDFIKACFPAGSITGAPKSRAMEIIKQLEKHPRNIYCGSIGYFSFSKNVDFSVAIRTITIQNKQLSFYAGGAVTLDSEPLAEYNETLLKAQKIIESL